MKNFYFPAIYILFLSIFFVHYLFSGQAVYGDGIGYYAYLHSWYFDADNDFTNEYQHIYNYENNNQLFSLNSDVVQIVGTNSQGQALNHFSPGMAILLLPFYVLADGVVVVANFLGVSLARNGYSNTYQLLVGIGAITYVIIAARLSEKFLRQFGFRRAISRTAVFILLFATNLLYYGSFDVLNSHFASFFLSILFFFYFFSHQKKLTTTNYFILGLIAGLLGITRPQDSVIAVVVLLDAVHLWKKTQVQLQQTIKNISLFFLPMLMIVTPLVIQWITTFDSISSHPYFLWISGVGNQITAYTFLGSLFHLTNGLFTRTPILFLAMAVFLYLVFKKKVEYDLKLLFVFFCLQYLIITLQGGWKAAAYGARMYISSLPFFLVLIAKFFEWIENEYSSITKWLIICLFIFLNFLSIGSFVLFEKGASGKRRGIEASTLARVSRAIIYLRGALRFR